MKKPVVATRVGGVPEVVKAGVTGYLVPPDNAPELALAIQDLLKDSATRKRMGEEGKKRVERLFTRRRFMHQLEAVYRQQVRRCLESKTVYDGTSGQCSLPEESSEQESGELAREPAKVFGEERCKRSKIAKKGSS